MAYAPLDEIRWQLDRLAAGRSRYLTLVGASRALRDPRAAPVLRRNAEAIARHPAARSFVVTDVIDAIERLA